MGLRPGYKQTDVGVIPEDWEVVLMGDISVVSSGGTPSRRVSEYWNGDIPWLTTTQIDFNVIDYANEFITDDGLKNSAAKIYPAGTLLMAMYGQGKTRGKVAKLGISAAVNQACAAISVTNSISKSFIFYYLSSRYREIRNLSNTGNQENLNSQLIRAIPIPLSPTKAEQEAIAEALSDADTFIESLEQLIAKKRQIKQGAMQKLLTGKKRLPGFGGTWEVKQFGDIVQPRKERIDPRQTGIQEFCVELEHIDQGAGRLIGYSATGEGASLKSVFKKDDVLFGKLRAYLRKYWLADRDGVCSTEIWALVANRTLLIPEYLFQLVRENRFVEVASTAYGTHMPRSDWKVVKNYEVELPSFPEQEAIATLLSDMDAEINALETKLVKAHQVKQGMMHNLLTGRIRLI
jgi:type I restriction enzyme, S subunit